jgi:AcrR family transcriptional regulator
MVRQARSEATRQTILSAAADVFSRIGYATATMRDIVAGSELTKGAFYYHFDSKESVASAIMEQTSAKLLRGFRTAAGPDAHALQKTIDGLVAVAEIVATDKLARTGALLIQTLGDSNTVASRVHDDWIAEIGGQAELASCEGDLRRDIEPNVVAELIFCTMLGALTWTASAHGDERQRLSQTCEILLSAVTSEESLPYYHDFLASRSLLPQRSSVRE